jgi:hypothetical protein
MTTGNTAARIMLVAGFCLLAGCDSGAPGPAGAAGTGGTVTVPTPVVPPEGKFVWTAGGVTVTANDSYEFAGLKAVGYRFSNTSLVIDAATEQADNRCVVGVDVENGVLPPAGRYPIGVGVGAAVVTCSDPSSPTGNYINATAGEVVITKAAPGDLEGTFTIAGDFQSASGGFNVRCIYPDCTSPR